MVMFRDFVQKKARRLALTGTVENITNGEVKVVAQGHRENLEKLIEHLHKGPFLARVSSVHVLWREPEKRFGSFDILYYR